MEASTKHWISLICLVITMIFMCVGYAGADGKVAWSQKKFTGDDDVRSCSTDSLENYGLLMWHQKLTSDKCSSAVKDKEYDIRYDTKGTYNSQEPEKLYCLPETEDTSDLGKAKQEFCETCNGVGKTIISFLTFGLIAALASVAAIWMKKTNPNAGGMVGVASWAAPAACAFCLMLCWTTWNGCNAKASAYIETGIKGDSTYAGKEPDEVNTVELAAGYAMAFVGMVLSIVAAVLQFVAKQDAAA